MTIALCRAMFDHHWPKAPHSLTDGMVATSAAAFAKYGLATAGRRRPISWRRSARRPAAERAVEEYASTIPPRGSARCGRRAFPRWPPDLALSPIIRRRWPTTSTAAAMAKPPGPTTAGAIRGRGLIQITFASMVRQARGPGTGLDLVGDPGPRQRSLARAGGRLRSIWKLAGVSAFANSGDFRGETLRVNGGLTNYPLRLQWRAIWRVEFGLAGLSLVLRAFAGAAIGGAPRFRPARPARVDSRRGARRGLWNRRSAAMTTRDAPRRRPLAG